MVGDQETRTPVSNPSDLEHGTGSEDLLVTYAHAASVFVVVHAVARCAPHVYRGLVWLPFVGSGRVVAIRDSQQA